MARVYKHVISAEGLGTEASPKMPRPKVLSVGKGHVAYMLPPVDVTCSFPPGSTITRYSLLATRSRDLEGIGILMPFAMSSHWTHAALS